MPAILEKKHQSIFVCREGSSPNAYMRTKNVVGEVLPQQCYQLQSGGLLPTHRPPTPPATTQTMPPHVVLQGKWLAPHADSHDRGNILGQNGNFLATVAQLQVPIAPTTHATLGYYGAQWLHVGDCLVLDTNVDLPITTMAIGATYLADYILQEQHAGGFFIEHHDLPHFHRPVDTQAHGYLVLSKKVNDSTYHLSAFTIPFGSAVYTPPHVIHNDCCLVGNYHVVYSNTPNFSTALLKTAAGAVLPVTVGPAVA